jgi:F-type H+-transporting ATPase subunit a
MSSSGALFEVAGFPVTSAMTTSLVITVVLTGVMFAGTRNLKVSHPGRFQSALEYVVGGLRDFYADIMGKERATAFLPVLGSLFLFIIVSNYSGLLPYAGKVPGFQPPTGVLGGTVALAMITFFTTHIGGFKYNGVHYLGHFVKPVAMLLPLMLLEEVIHPLSLSLRLYGNIHGEETVLEQVSELIPLGAPIIIMVLSLLFGFIQALVFTMLSAIYIESATGHGH